jgi:transcriptional regulator with XRE-family HTH domain
MELREKLRIARKRAALQQAEVAAKLGVATGTVRAWEAGRTAPRGPHLRAFAQLTGYPLSWFTDRPEDDLPEPQPTLDMEALQRIVNRDPEAPRGADFPGVQELLSNPELCRQLGVTEADKRLLAECYVAQVGPGTVAEAVKLLDVLRQMSVHR